MLISRCRCAAHRRPPQATPTLDALPGRDPTGTRDVREAFVRAMNARWRTLRRLVFEAVAVHDIAGTGGASVSSVSAAVSASRTATFPLFGLDKVRAFQAWLDEALKQVVLGDDGAWMRPYIAEAYARAWSRAGKLASSELPIRPDRVVTLASLTTVELQGAMEAVSQQAVRALSAGLLAHNRPMRIARAMARVVRSVGMVRGRATADTMVVRTHAEATLDAFQAAGVRRVGILPERVAAVPRPRVGDAVTRDAKKGIRQRGRGRVKPDEVFPQEVEVLTAGDDDVCPVCEDIAALGPYTIAMARGLIPAHPWCRCGFVPYFDERFAHETPEE